MVKTFVRRIHGPRAAVGPRLQSHGVRKSTPMAMQTRHGRRQQAALLAMEPFFTNNDLLSLVIKEALPAAALPAVCKQWRALAGAEWIWKSKVKFCVNILAKTF